MSKVNLFTKDGCFVEVERFLYVMEESTEYNYVLSMDERDNNYGYISTSLTEEQLKDFVTALQGLIL